MSLNINNNNIFENLRDEGFDGLNYAYDSNNVFTFAKNAKPGDQYTCPCCKIPMHLRITKSGKPIFARNPNTVHTHPLCLSMDQNKTKRELGDKSPEELFGGICHVAPHKKDVVNKEKNVTETNTCALPTDVDSNNEFIKVAQASALKHLHEMGIEFLNPDDKYGDYKVSDYVLTYKFAQQCLNDPNYNYKAKSIYVRFLYANSKNSTLVFILFCGKDFSVRYHLIFKSKIDYQKVLGKFGSFIEDSQGRYKFEKHYKEQNALICSDDWKHLSKENCNTCCHPSNSQYCNSCYGVFQADVTNIGQIFLIPSDH